MECDYIELDWLFEIHPRKEKNRTENKSNHDIESQPTAEFQITPSVRNPKMTKKLK